MHKVYFVQFDSPMVKTQNLKYKNQFPKIKELFFRLTFLYCLRMKTLKLVSLFIFRHWKHYVWSTQNNPEIANLEFENHENNLFHVYLAIEQAGTNIC